LGAIVMIRIYKEIIAIFTKYGFVIVVSAHVAYINRD
jgi:hypothetical protein